MTVRSPQEEQQHNSLIESLIASLEQRGYHSIRAGHLSAFADRRPDPIYCELHEHHFVPDIIAEKDGQQVLFEVETSGSLDAPSTQVELRAFAAHASANNMLYYLVVPETIRKRAEMVLEMISERRQRSTFVLSLPS